MKYEDHIEDALFGALSQECRVEVDEARATFALLVHAATPVAPPPALRAQILEQIKQHSTGGVTDTGATAQRTGDASRNASSAPTMPGSILFPRRMFAGGLVAASLLLIGLLVGLFALMNQRAQLRTELDQARVEQAQERVEQAREREATDLLTRPESRIAALAGTSVVPRADGRVAYDRSTGQVAVFIHDLPPAPAGLAYQLWFLTPDARKIPSTLFSTNAAGDAVVRGNVPADERANTAGFAVTLEPQTGSAQPTSEIYLATPAS